MRKLFWLFMMLMLAACGSGGGGTTANTPASGKGVLSIELVQAGGAVAKRVAALPTTAPGRFRVVLNETTTHYRTVADKAVGESTSLSIEVPVGTYTVEAIYYEQGTPNVLYQYGKALTNATINPGGNTLSAVTLADVDVITRPVPAAVVSGQAYTVGTIAATDLAAKGLQDKWSLATSTSPFTVRQNLAPSASTTHTGLIAEKVGQTGELHFLLEFFMKSDLLDANETSSNWAFYKEYTATLNVPTASVGVPSSLTDNQPPVVKSFSVPGRVGTSGVVAGIGIVATDNGGVKEYAITSSTDPVTVPAPVEADWHPTPYFEYNGTLDNTDRTVYVYAWARDFAGNPSVQMTDVTKKQIVFNNSPVISNFTVPSAVVMDGDNVAVTIQGKTYVAGNLECTVTETATLPADAVWRTMDAPTATRPVYSLTFNYNSSINQAIGGRYNVPLYAWIKDSAGHTSSSLYNSVVVSDKPQVTVLTATGAATGNTATITAFDYAVKSGRSITGYAITPTSAVPATFTDGIPAIGLTYTFTGVTTYPTTRALYLWLKDSENVISSSRGVGVTLRAPAP